MVVGGIVGLHAPAQAGDRTGLEHAAGRLQEGRHIAGRHQHQQLRVLVHQRINGAHQQQRAIGRSGQQRQAEIDDHARIGRMARCGLHDEAQRVEQLHAGRCARAGQRRRRRQRHHHQGRASRLVALPGLGGRAGGPTVGTAGQGVGQEAAVVHLAALGLQAQTVQTEAGGSCAIRRRATCKRQTGAGSR
jgi:hypothetical protein